MAAIAIIVGRAVLNAATFIGGNYIAKALSGDSGQAALDEKKQHDLALEKYQRDYAQYQKDRTQLLDWVAEQDREKNQAFHDFQNTDQALALYNQTHRAKVAKVQVFVLVGANFGLARHVLACEHKAWPTDYSGLQYVICLFVGGIQLGGLVTLAPLQRLAQDVLL